MASGLIIVLINKATKLSSEFLRLSKEYTAVIKLGIETDTLDIEGSVLSEKNIGNISIEDINRVLEGFRGTTKQLPPMYSALKHNGKPLYKIARSGRSVERKTRDVDISRIELEDFDGRMLTIKVCCSSGTYIRSLAGDIGSALGTGAALYALDRTRIGNFSLGQSIGLEEFSDIADAGILPEDNKMLISIEGLLKNNPSIYINTGEDKAVINGKRLSIDMIDTEKTDIRAINNLYKNKNSDFYGILLVRGFSGNVLAVHSIIDEIKPDEPESLEKEFTKSIVIF